MVAVVLLTLATTVMGTFLLDFSRQAARYERRQDLILGAEKVLLRMVSLLSDSRASLVTADTTIAGVYFPVAEDSKQNLQFDSSGNVMWQRYEAFGFDAAKGIVYEAQLPLATPTYDATLLAKGVTSAPSTWARRTQAGWVKEFAVSGPVGGAFRIRLLVIDSLGYQMEIASTVVPQN